MSDVWQQAIAESQALRRELHRAPELAWREYRTAEVIRDRLGALDIPWRACAGTGTVATLNPRGKGGVHIALRGDMDALPIDEQSGVQWRSANPGCMHACGHDGHTATLLACAQWLKAREAELPGPVTLLFQPAEEGGHGAREMIAGGALEGIDCIYGWHNWPAMAFGRLHCPEGLVMCGNGTFSIDLRGRGGHASHPEQCANPTLAAGAVGLALQDIVSRHFAPEAVAVVAVTSIEAPSAPTVIPESATLGGSIRFSDPAVRDRLNALIEQTAREVAADHGVRAELSIQPRYDATINHAGPARRVREAWAGLYGEAGLDTGLSGPIRASEDFSYYLKEIPGAFALIGSDDGEPRHGVPCHSPRYDFNDRLLPLVVRWFSCLVGAPQPTPSDSKTQETCEE